MNDDDRKLLKNIYYSILGIGIMIAFILGIQLQQTIN